jgi:prophage antirepressor-like protein
MATTFIDLFNNIIQYNGNQVYLAFHTETYQPFFNAKHVCDMLGYVNHKETLRTIISKKYIFKLSNIDKNYKTLYKNVQGNTNFLNEAGFYKLIFKSRKKNATKISEWITDQVMPSIRKYGEYILTNEHKKEIETLNDKMHNMIVSLNKQLKEKDEIIDVLKHNMKTRKYPVDGMVYLLRTIEVSLDLDKNEKIDIKIGSSKEMNKRKFVLDTTTKNKTQLLKFIEVKNAKNIEQCTLTKMENALIKVKKDYVFASYNEIMMKIAECIKFFEGIDINIEPDMEVPIRIPSRKNTVKFDRNKKYKINFVMDDDDELNEITQYGSGYCYYDSGEMEYTKTKLDYLRLCLYCNFIERHPDVSNTFSTQSGNNSENIDRFNRNHAPNDNETAFLNKCNDIRKLKV